MTETTTFLADLYVEPSVQCVVCLSSVMHVLWLNSRSC